MLMPVIKKGAAVASFIVFVLMSFNVSAKISGLPDFTHLVEEYSEAPTVFIYINKQMQKALFDFGKQEGSTEPIIND